MTSKTITDRAGDTLRLSTGSLTAGPGEITVKVTERFRGREAVAAVHVDPVALRAALDEVAPAGSYTRTDEGWQARAEKAEQERDHLATVLATTARQRDEADKRNARPLTPDAITDEMIERARTAWNRSSAIGNDLWRDALAAALTEPPKRPEGAEEMEALIGSWERSELLGQNLTADDLNSLADHLAERGVRVARRDEEKRDG